MKTILMSLMVSALACIAAAEGAEPAISLVVKPEREVLKKGGSRDTVLQVEVQARPADKKRNNPINIAIVLDRSGSMGGEKLEKARQAAAAAVDQLEPEDIFSLVTYDNDVDLLIPPQRVKDKEAIKRLIFSIQSGGSTALYAGIEKGAAQIRKYIDDERVNRIILLSDGLANVGPSSVSDLARLGKELRGEGISVSTIGLGADYNEDLMTALAEASYANYYYVQDAETLPDIFSKELGSVKSMVGRSAQVIITLPEGVKPVGVIGEKEMTFQGQTLTIPLKEFFASQTRRFLISCQAPDVKSDTINMAKVELSYIDAATGESMRGSGVAAVRQSDSAEDSDKSVQADVAANHAITASAEAKMEAIRLADEGKMKEAAQVLDTQYRSNAALAPAVMGASQRLPEMQSELKAAGGALAGEKPLSQTGRKQMQYDNYKDRNQKN